MHAPKSATVRRLGGDSAAICACEKNIHRTKVREEILLRWTLIAQVGRRLNQFYPQLQQRHPQRSELAAVPQNGLVAMILRRMQSQPPPGIVSKAAWARRNWAMALTEEAPLVATEVQCAVPMGDSEAQTEKPPRLDMSVQHDEGAESRLEMAVQHDEDMERNRREQMAQMAPNKI